MTLRGKSNIGEQLAIPVPTGGGRSPLAEPCMKCGAARGEPCRTVSDGSVARTTHKVRRRAARFKPVVGNQ